MADLSRPQPIAPPAPFLAQRLSLVARLWATRCIWLGLGAGGIALWALTWLGDPARRTAAMGALTLAGVLAVIAWGGWRPAPGMALARGVPAAGGRPPRLRPGRVGVARGPPPLGQAAPLTL